jgi:hypothetical protein
MANGVTVSPIGASFITVTLHDKLAMGTAVVMHMEGMDLLLGNDFLNQFGKLQIEYQASKTLITVRDLPLNVIEQQKIEMVKPSSSLTTEGVNVSTDEVQNRFF